MKRAIQILGPLSLVLVALDVVMGLWVTPPDQTQGDFVRLVYVHPALAWVGLYLAFGLAALMSILYLWKRTRSLTFDRMAAAAVEVGVVFAALTLVTGSIWGRPTWGVWWTWDARLTSTAVLCVLFIGYLALRRVPADPEVRAKRCAVAPRLDGMDPAAELHRLQHALRLALPHALPPRGARDRRRGRHVGARARGAQG